VLEPLVTDWRKKEEQRLLIYFFVMTEQEEKAHYCTECGKKLKAFNLTSYSKYLCPDCDELEHECFTGEGP
jgi:Zn finger protein HypA/HybF involved in hydrogenase expression